MKNRKTWTRKDFSSIFAFKEKNLSSKQIAQALGITTNALYKAVQRFRRHEKKLRNHTNLAFINLIDEPGLLALAKEYRISVRHKNMVQIIHEINNYRSKHHLSKVILNY